MFPLLQQTWLVIISLAVLTLVGCTPEKNHIVKENHTYPTEATFGHLHIALNESLPYTSDAQIFYQGVAVTLTNTSNEAINLPSMFSRITVFDTTGQDITNQIDWQTTDEHGRDLASLKKIAPNQTIIGHVYYRSEATPHTIMLTHKKKPQQLQLPPSSTVPIASAKKYALPDDAVEAKVQVIRTWFNQIEANAQANQMNVQHIDNIVTYDAEAYRKVTYHYQEMTYHFYYMNDELFFAYTYPNVEAVASENRYYFQDNMLIRWIKADGTTINQTAGNTSANFLQQEANIKFLANKIKNRRH